MVNLDNFFGKNKFGARLPNPNSDRQRALACKDLGKVYDKETKKCRDRLPRGRAPGAGVGPSIASLRAACKARGLVLDMDTKECRDSRRGAGLAAARTARAVARTLAGPTQKDMMAMCKAQGLVFDRETKQCRPSKRRTKKARDPLEQAYRRGSLFFGKNKFGARLPNPNSDRQRALACKDLGKVYDKETKKCRDRLPRGRAPAAGAGPSIASLRAACRAQGLVLDMDTKECRDSRRAVRAAALAGRPTQKDMMAMCKAQGLVFDRETKQCRPSKKARDPLEQAYARGSLFFGVNRPASHQRTGIVYSGPASALTSPSYGIIGPVSGKITGPASFQVSSSNITPAMRSELGVSVPNPPAAKPSKFGTYTKRNLM